MNKTLLFVILLMQLVLSINSAYGQSLNDSAYIEAKSILERISGVKVSPTNPLLEPMIQKVKSGDLLGAAEIATTHPSFLNITVKQMALAMSTREETFRIALNDFAATFMGVTRDELDARELLTGNYYYRANMSKIPADQLKNVSDVNKDESITDSNAHYASLDIPGINAGDVLEKTLGQILGTTVKETQADGKTANVYYSVPNPDPAGALTSRSFLMAHTVAGTNRRAVEFTFREFMCSPIETWADTKVPDVRIGRDIDRFPGGDHQKFQSNCKGCHTGMDGFRGAFAKWDATNNRVGHGDLGNGGTYDTIEGEKIARKFNQNNTVFPDGYVTKNNSWINNARGPANVNLFGWRSPETTGNGLQSLGKLISNSKRFSQCMVKHVFESVCRRSLNIDTNTEFVHRMATDFEGSKYNLKKLFENVVIEKKCTE